MKWVVKFEGHSLIAISGGNEEKPESNGLSGTQQFHLFEGDADGKRLLNEEFNEYKPIGSFSFAPMPGCCGVVVSMYSFLQPTHRHSEWSEPFRRLKAELAQALGYSCMIATTQLKNIEGMKNFARSGYQQSPAFRNKRTKNELVIGWKFL